MIRTTTLFFWMTLSFLEAMPSAMASGPNRIGVRSSNGGGGSVNVEAHGAAEDSAADRAEMESLLSVLEEETAIATLTRMNTDFVPGVVTVLHAEEMKALGVRTVWEALFFVPGVQPVRDSRARPSVIVRGLYFPFNSGNIKLLVDSVPLSRESTGINPFVLQMPIDQVERIEFIRGPGSVVHGDFAFMGLVNIVTRKDGKGLFARGDTERRIGAGGRAAWSSGGERPVSMYANIAGLGGWSSPFLEDLEGDERQATGVFGMGWGGLKLSGQIIRETATPDSGSADDTQADPLAETDGSVELSYAREVTARLGINLRAGFLRNTIAGGNDDFSGKLIRTGMDATWEGWSGHQMVAGVEHMTAFIDNAHHRRPPLPPGALPGGGPADGGGEGAPGTGDAGGGPPAPPPDISVTDDRRYVESVFAQDAVSVGHNWTITPGLRFDHYSDVDRRLTPRLAVVWRLTDHHILKGQYGEGYRAPTFFELAEQVPGDPLDFEVVGTGELTYIFRQPNTVGRATLFHSRIRDMIYRVPDPSTPGFTNSSSAQSIGAELEGSRQFFWWLKGTANASWVDVKDKRIAAEGEVAAPWMFDVAGVLTPLARTVFGLHLNHVVDRDAADGYVLMDVSITRTDLALDGLSLRLGVKNALNDEILYVDTRPGNLRTFALPGRLIWAGIEWND